MTPQQLAILNSLVTYAAENIPHGLSRDERDVAQIAGAWALVGSMKTYNYKTVNASEHRTIAEAANFWAERGWRVVAVVSDTRAGYAHSLVLERPLGMSHPDD